MPKISIRTVAVLLFGPPGSGKGTVSKHLTGCFDIPHISTGDIFRENVKAGTALGLEVKAIMDAGGLVTDELVNRIVADRVKKPDCEHGFILDGYPRTMEQGRYLVHLLKEQGLEPLVIGLDVDYTRIVSRLTARRSCPKCGAVYNVISMPPKVDGSCDVCSTALITRADDLEDVINQRLRAYDEQTAPLIDFFKQSTGMYYSVDGNEGSAEDIAERACHVIRSYE